MYVKYVFALDRRFCCPNGGPALATSSEPSATSLASFRLCAPAGVRMGVTALFENLFGKVEASSRKTVRKRDDLSAAVSEEQGGTRRRPMAPQPHTHSVLLRGPDWPPASAPPAELRRRLVPEFCPGGDTNRTRPSSARAAADPSPPPPPERREEARDGGISRNHALPRIRGGLLVKESGSLGQKCVCKVHRYVFMHPTFLVTPLVSWPATSLTTFDRHCAQLRLRAHKLCRRAPLPSGASSGCRLPSSLSCGTRRASSARTSGSAAMPA